VCIDSWINTLSGGGGGRGCRLTHLVELDPSLCRIRHIPPHFSALRELKACQALEYLPYGKYKDGDDDAPAKGNVCSVSSRTDNSGKGLFPDKSLRVC
jgi:hypothetical protein